MKTPIYKVASKYSASKRCNFVQLKYRDMSLLIDYLQIPDLIKKIIFFLIFLKGVISLEAG
jgi:hypothetical protein